MSQERRLDFQNHIVLDWPVTWPVSIISLIEKEQKNLKAFLKEKKRIEKVRSQSKNICDRVKKYENEFKMYWDKTIYNIQEIIKNEFIVGIHCSRLIDYEIEEIKNNGLQILNSENAIDKINTAFNKGFLSNESRNDLLKIDVFNDNDRKGMLCCFLCFSTLKESEGIDCFFESWGGESIYYFAKRKEELKKIGMPCLVLLSIKISELSFFYKLSEIMLLIFFNASDATDPNTELEKDTEVIAIIRENDKNFKKLISGEVIQVL